MQIQIEPAYPCSTKAEMAIRKIAQYHNLKFQQRNGNKSWHFRMSTRLKLVTLKCIWSKRNNICFKRKENGHRTSYWYRDSVALPAAKVPRDIYGPGVTSHCSCPHYYPTGFIFDCVDVSKIYTPVGVCTLLLLLRDSQWLCWSFNRVLKIWWERLYPLFGASL